MRELGLFKIRQRLLAVSGKNGRPQLNAAGPCLEARITIGAQQALLILLVFVACHLCRNSLHFIQAVTVVLTQLGIEELIGRFHAFPQLGAHTATHINKNFQVRLGIGIVDDLVHSANEVLVAAVVRRYQAFMFNVGGKRQHNIAQRHNGGGHEDVVRDHELKVLHSLIPAFGLVSHASKRVIANNPAHAQLVVAFHIGPFALKPVQQRVALNATHSSTCVEQGVFAIGVNNVLCRHFGVKNVHHVVAPLANEARGLRDGNAAGNINVAANGANGQEALSCLRGGLGLVKRNTPGSSGGSIRCEGTRGANQLFGINPGNFLHTLGRPFLAGFGQLFKTIRPALNELVIIQAFADDDIQKAQANSGIGTRTKLQMELRMGSKPRYARVDNDDLRATLNQVDNAGTEEAIGAGIQRVFAPDHDVFRNNVARMIVAIFPVLSGVDFRNAGAQQVVGDGSTRAVARFAGECVRGSAVRRVADSGTIHRSVQR